MQKHPMVRRAQPAEAAEVARVFATAAMDEAVTDWVLQDQPDLAAQFRSERAPDMINRALDTDEVWLAGTDTDIWAVSIWQTVTSLDRIEAEAAEMRAMAEELPLQPFRRMAAVTAAVAAQHPREFPHQYLHVIVTLPEYRGKGAGAAIVTDRVKAASIPSYLEASTERSARLYQRCGFALTGTQIELPEDGPTLRPMWFQG